MDSLLGKELAWSQWYHLLSSLGGAVASSGHYWLKASKPSKRDITLLDCMHRKHVSKNPVRQVIIFFIPVFNFWVLNLHFSCSECICNILLVLNIVGLLLLSFQSMIKNSCALSLQSECLNCRWQLSDMHLNNFICTKISWRYMVKHICYFIRCVHAAYTGLAGSQKTWYWE